MDVVAQFVRTWWTKESRGGEAAGRRNALPLAFVLPDDRRPLTHEVTMDEADGFEPRSVVRHDEPERAAVRLREEAGALRVMVVSAQFHGLLRRRPPAVRLRPGQWLRWRINYRFRTYGGVGPWRYRLDTLNLAFGPDIDREIFLGTPTRVVDERAELR